MRAMRRSERSSHPTRQEGCSTGETAILDHLAKLCLTEPRLIIGNRDCLRDIARLYLRDWFQLSQIFLDLACAPSKVKPFDRQCDGSHRFHPLLVGYVLSPTKEATLRTCLRSESIVRPYLLVKLTHNAETPDLSRCEQLTRWQALSLAADHPLPLPL